MQPVEIAWVAGLLEGEGSFFSRKSSHNYMRPRISMQLTDHDVIEKLQRTTGVGSLNQVGDRVGKKRCWNWSVDRYEDVMNLAATLYPFLGSRRQQQIQDMVDRSDPPMKPGRRKKVKV